MTKVNLSTVDANSTLPAGSYSALITNVVEKPTKSGNGTYCQVEFTVTTQGAVGWKVYDVFNIVNQNEQAQKIGLSRLKSLAIAAGIQSEKLSSFDTSELGNKEVKITTSIKTDATYGEKAEIKKYSSLTEKDKSTQTSEIPF